MTFLDRVMKYVIRREDLIQRKPACPVLGCGEERQIQLVQWLFEPARWKCRTCGHKWDQETLYGD